MAFNFLPNMSKILDPTEWEALVVDKMNVVRMTVRSKKYRFLRRCRGGLKIQLSLSLSLSLSLRRPNFPTSVYTVLLEADFGLSAFNHRRSFCDELSQLYDVIYKT